jgi:hypothetical protein
MLLCLAPFSVIYSFDGPPYYTVEFKERYLTLSDTIVKVLYCKTKNFTNVGNTRWPSYEKVDGEMFHHLQNGHWIFSKKIDGSKARLSYENKLPEELEWEVVIV